MNRLIDEIKKIEFKTDPNFRFDLDKEFEVISSYLNIKDKKLLKTDFDFYLKKGKFLVFNTLVVEFYS